MPDESSLRAMTDRAMTDRAMANGEQPDRNDQLLVLGAELAEAAKREQEHVPRGLA